LARPGKPTTIAKRQAAAAQPRAAVDYRDLMAAADRVAREYLRVKESSYFAALEVSEEATAEEIETAYQRKLASLTGDPGVAASSQDVVKRARQVTDSLAEARRVLLDPAARAQYLSKIASGEASIDISVDTDTAAPADNAGQRREALINAEQAFREGSRLLESGDPAAARSYLEVAIRLNASEPAYRAAMAQIVLAIANPDADSVALAHLEDALRLDPTNLMANVEAAKLLSRLGQTQQAKNHLDRVLQRAPHHQLAKKMMAELDAAG
jgi:tetratricopeptide (TPR) repeat protein